MVHAVKYSLIDRKVIQYFLKGYGLSPFSECRFLTRGLNDTYTVHTDKDTYIFRIYRQGWRDENAIMYELEAILNLHDKGLPVSFPIKRTDGSYLCEINAPEGTRYGVLFTYAKGERPQINADNAQIIGTTLGKLHNESDTFQTTYKRGFDLNMEHLVDKPATKITPVLQEYLGKKAVDSFTEIINHIKETLADKELEVGFCHGDFHNHNMHIYNENVQIFDFDCCGMGFRAYDVAVTWWNLLHNYKNQEEECWNAFLNGYLSQRKLYHDDVESLQTFITIRRIWLIGTMIENDDVWGMNWMNKEAFEIFMLQLKSDTMRGRVDE